MPKEFITLDDGKIAYQIYGKGQQTLILFHGLIGSSWLSQTWIEAIEQADVSCIALERPGYGDSSPFTITCVADWNAIFAQVIEILSLKSAIAVGCSAGAVYAYASAFACPGVVTHVWVLGGVPAVFLDRVMRHYSRADQATYKWFLKASMAEIQDYYARQLDAFSKQHFKNTESYILSALNDARTTNYFGMSRESQLQISPWGFDISAIQQPVTIWHSAKDDMVPYKAVYEMPHLLKNSTFMIAEDFAFSPASEPHSESISQGFLYLLQQLNQNTSKE